jgi:ESS family glutamate:Na+ symporter
MIALLLAASILAIASYLVKRNKFLSFYRIPPSLVSSIPLLALFTYFGEWKTEAFYLEWKSWPGVTIALVFAALFLEVPEKKEGLADIKPVVAQTSMVFIAILGQMVLGIILSILLFQPVFGLPLSFASVLEAGFAGGHGTAVALEKPFLETGLVGGKEYSLFTATVGILLGIAGGILLVGKRRKEDLKLVDTTDEYTEEDDVKGFSLNSFLAGFGLISLCVLLGAFLENLSKKMNLPTLPLFVYSLVVSVIFRNIIQHTGQSKYLNNSLYIFFSAFFMEFLIFSAIITMDLQVISDALVPLLILVTAGFIWNLFCHIVLRKILLPNAYGFELSIINFGMLNGTTAIGLMLLKIIDPGLQSKAVKVYAESAPFTSPFVGGGILSLTLPYLLTKQNPYVVLILLIFTMILSYLLGKNMNSKIQMERSKLG